MGERRRRARAVSLAGAVRGALLRTAKGSLDFTVRVYEKAGEDDIFFLAGGIAFNLLVVAIPFLLLIISIFGFVLESVVENPVTVAVEYVTALLPPSREVREYTTALVTSILAERTRFGVLGLILFVWITTRLIGTLRTVLRFVFDLQDDRGIIKGKIFDLQMVVVAGSLFLANTGITLALETVRNAGTDWLERWRIPIVRVADPAWAQLLAFAFIFMMFILIYRYLPARRTPWRIALVAAIFASVAWELLKGIFTWYVAYVANFGTAYGRVATLVVLVFWIYYSAVVFILGGEVGQVYDLNRTRRKQRELLE
jgi:membrane protein